MNDLPDEIVTNILDCTLKVLHPKDIVSSQRVSTRLLKLARDNSLWRYKSFEGSPSAVLASKRSNSLAALTGALGSLSISDSSESCHAPEGSENRQYVSKRAQAAASWDASHPTEKVDWYSEYIARHATLSTHWRQQDSAECQDVRGIALLGDSGKAVGPLDDGSLCIWDISPSRSGRRHFREIARAASRTCFEDPEKPGGPSSGTSSLTFTGAVDCINADLARNKAYVGVQDILNEIDLNTLQLVSQHKYAWPITALSQGSTIHDPLTVGTSWSLHLYDPRCQMRDRSRSPEDLLRPVPGEPEESIAFLPNYSKPIINANPSDHPSQLEPAQRIPRRSNLSGYARIEPGPLSILHHGSHEILIAGRFPSVLSYDRRYFPRLQYAIHSGARLSTLAISPFPPRGAGPTSQATATLIAAGEYGGRGSLELYALPHGKHDPARTTDDFGILPTSTGMGLLDSIFPSKDSPYSYKNRQAASTSKLFAVATQGARIVFSDAEGGLNWVERNGIDLVRRWNMNAFEVDGAGARVVGEQVVRKIVSLDAGDSERGVRGDGDLLVWTGENIGIVSTKPQKWEGEDGNETETSSPSSADTPEEPGAEYSRQMRMALERQADEARWMRRFRLNRSG